mmetsp:Transcript_27379/g.27608  ORF Transcript_27379/g.27608 Transcript_27379/m.27608 type:complete len:272 (-) Transcript_27379:115-930(-)|eukprot:CAMPEP_0182428754 /NCGR_PEP_ID=MMETSP1167-20130531/23358_1 /TAXON_ID=2988 /ORGANISM="Mallomonas Sp, Strain CCMP3275" /LENGTH=271 /DNA_ID=CAMNT_0024611821 /DNA_START=34 /DNA_END=849 /DNA_ORIENTATION=+
MAEVWAAYLAFGVPPARRALIGGNWKCNGTTASIKKMVEVLNNAGPFPVESEVVIAAPSVYLSFLKSIIRKDIAVSAEDVALTTKNGAFTGEVNGAMLADIGLKWALTGHSERRVGFGYPGETSDVVGKKTKAAITAGLSAIACIGEQLADRQSGKTMAVCAEQLAAIAAALEPNDWAKVVIAYEPVWAIGTGVTATPAQAEETHKQVREWLAANVSAEVARKTRIIYGGSAKASNCKELIACPNIDGFLVGGASLLPEFVDIIKCTPGNI